MKKFFGFIFLSVGAIISMALLDLDSVTDPLTGQKSEGQILFQSEESSTDEIGPIFNRIYFSSTKTNDLWLMQQQLHSQSDIEKPIDFNFSGWDRLAIVIDKTKKPNEANFFQLPPGPIDNSEKNRILEEIESGTLKTLPYKVSCGVCHSSGPRSIRPTPNGKSLIPLGFKDWIKIQYWNYKIENYRNIKVTLKKVKNESHIKIPFRYGGLFANEVLKVRSCTKCHNGKQNDRAVLTRQNFPSIQFMLEKNYMPPFGYPISENDRKEIEEFVKSSYRPLRDSPNDN